MAYHDLSAAFSAQRKEGHTIAPLSRDPDENFPDDDPNKQRQLAGRLFNAMRNRINVLDGTIMKDANKQVILDANGEPRKSENNTIRRVCNEPNIRLEMVAWGPLLAIRGAQLGDFYALKWTWDHNFEYQYYDSFMDRYNSVLAAVTGSKKAVADLMETSWSCRLANTPEHELHRKGANRRDNDYKQELLAEATAKRKQDREVHEEEENQGTTKTTVGRV
ncbi:hypothetical protein N8I77_010328 [Diaporthe amygdali]|uniref:Uncharacterized protein n=1 Tax=Phomopsis amygdali TaxID=1214568 RepID=A0AAD9VZ08_PHOAM|nr:hypothetical protein N8I77_010328 [Diaporthe amygdali]